MAEYNLGSRYQNGKGTPKDDAQAAGWYRKAAKKRYAPAQFNLGSMYSMGDGVLKDLGQAVHW